MIEGLKRRWDENYFERYSESGTKPEPAATYSDDCYLMDYLDIFVGLNVNVCNPNGYKNFKVLNAPLDSGAGEIISRLSCRDGLRRFLDITPAQLAVLQPRVRLYKLVYPEAGSSPIKEEFIFDDFYSRSSVDAILGGNRKRIGGAGLTEVNWIFNGTNPAEAEKCIEVEMSFQFQSAADFLGDRYDPTDGNILEGNTQDLKANFVDMILQPPNKEDAFGAKAAIAARNGEHVPTYYKIAMEVGWALPQLKDKKFPGLTTAETLDLRSNLEAQNHTIILTHVEHKIDIEENGGMSVTLNMVGAMETVLDDPENANILTTSNSGWGIHPDDFTPLAVESTKARLAELEERIECLKLADDGSGDSTKLWGDGSAMDVMANSVEEFNKELTKHENQLQVNTEAAKFDVYKEFLEKLKPKIRKVEMNKVIIGKWLMSIDSAAPRPDFYTDVADGGLVGTLNNSSHKRGLSIGDYTPEDVTSEGWQQLDGLGDGGGVGMENSAADDAWTNVEIDAAINASTDFHTSEIGEKDTTSHAEATAENLEEKAESIDKHYLKWIFLGDLVEAACQMMQPGSALPADNMRIALGPVTFKHPRGGRALKFNLADLPISYERIMAFFLDNIVKPSLDHYTIKKFINHILNNIVKDMLTPSKCFPRKKNEGFMSIRQSQFDIHTRTAEQAGMMPDCTGRFNVSNLPSQNPVPYGAEGNKITVGLFYASTSKAAELRGFSDGDENGQFNDREKGIYHFHIGGESGILKKVDFEKSDIKYQREARQSMGNMLARFKDLYNAKVTLAGNSLFIPGMTVFINPPIGMGLPQQDGSDGKGHGSISNLLGMGGYYSVISVESNISSGGQYETVLDCIWYQSGGKSESVESQCREVLTDMLNNPGFRHKEEKQLMAQEALSALDRAEIGDD